MKKNKLIKFALIMVLTIIFNIYGHSQALAATTCEQKYLNAFAKCSLLCSDLGADYKTDNSPDLCAAGVCCYKTAGETATGASLLDNLQLQVPIFDVANVNNLPEYIITLYRYILIILVPLAIVMMIIGGGMWIIAAGDQSKIQNAKNYIISALSGLLIGLFSYIILSLVGITELRPPVIEFIKPLEYIPEATYTNITGQPVKDKSEYYAMGEQLAKEKGLHPCFMKTMIDMESGGRANVIGHDENARNEAAKKGKVPARREFLKSGKTLKGITFATITSAPYNSTQKNDDTPVCEKEDLCLDWRWSHGIGLSQFTISGTVASTALGAWCKSGVPSRSFGGKCYTAKELFDPKVSLGIGADMLKKYPTSRAYDAFKAYNGSDEYARDAKSRFDKCCSERGGC